MPSGVPEAEQAWLREHYADGTIYDTLDAFEAEFGWRPGKRTLYMRAHALGLRKLRQDPEFRGRRAETIIRWSCEPEMEAWMLENDGGRPHEDVASAFYERFGIWLTRGQINIFRARHGLQTKEGAGGRPARPIGYERRTKGGILVKVAEKATVPMSKDNWRFKHHIAYEEAWGPIPEGYVVMAVDGDSCNCDPDNLVAMPRRTMGAVNQLRGEGATWATREEFLAVAAERSLAVAINDAESRIPRKCAVCGAEFAETEEQRRYGSRTATCPACIAAGRRARGDRGDKAPTVCAVCGRTFPRSQKNQRRCPECIARSPKRSAARQREEESRGPASSGAPAA